MDRKAIAGELVCFIFCASVLVFALRALLLDVSHTFPHDSFYWNFPLFFYVADSLLSGALPLWNPFSHGGEPFYPLLGQMRLIEPLTLAVIYFGHFFTHDIVALFNWNRFLHSLLMVMGIYLVLRPWARYGFVRGMLIFVLCLSSIMFVHFRQDGVIHQFIWIPFIAYFLVRIFYRQKTHIRNWVGLTVFVGLNWQSYWFTGTWLFLIGFFVGMWIYHRQALFRVIRSSSQRKHILLSVLGMTCMMAPNLVLFFEQGFYAFPARMVESRFLNKKRTGGPMQYEARTDGLDRSSGIMMPYKHLFYTGSTSKPWDFIQLLNPNENDFIHADPNPTWKGYSSEAFLYFGALAWALMVVGMFWGKHELKGVWTVMTVFWVFMILGPFGALYTLVYPVVPILWFARHTHCFVLIFCFLLAYYFVLGGNWFGDQLNRRVI